MAHKISADYQRILPKNEVHGIADDESHKMFWSL